MYWSIIGISAAALTSSGFIPQIIKGIRTKKLEDVSSGMMAIWIIGTFLWFLYGWHLSDLIIMGANVFTCSCGVITLYLKFHFKRISNILPLLDRSA